MPSRYPHALGPRHRRGDRDVGGSLNAYTGREITAYHASVLKEDVALGVEMVADILRNSVFDPDELQRERGVILQEIGQALDTPDDLIFDQFQETALPGSRWGRPVLGTADSVEAIGRDHLFAFLARHYTASNMVLSAAGSGRARRNRRAGEKHSARCRARRQCEQPVPLLYVGGDGREARELEQAHLVLGCQASAIAIRLLRHRHLLDAVRRRHVLHACSSASARSAAWSMAFTASRRLCRWRLFGHLCRHGQDDLSELVPAVSRNSPASPETLRRGELVRARNQIKPARSMVLSPAAHAASRRAAPVDHGRRRFPIAEIVARIEAVDQEAVVVARVVSQGQADARRPGADTSTGPLDKIAARLALSASGRLWPARVVWLAMLIRPWPTSGADGARGGTPMRRVRARPSPRSNAGWRL